MEKISNLSNPTSLFLLVVIMNNGNQSIAIYHYYCTPTLTDLLVTLGDMTSRCRGDCSLAWSRDQVLEEGPPVLFLLTGRTVEILGLEIRSGIEPENQKRNCTN